MAIYHLHASTGSRKGGQSGAAKSDYIRREGKYTRDPNEVLATGDGNMPNFASDHPADYWKAADDFERENGRLFKEVEFSLPRELSLEQQQTLVDQFAAELTDGERLPFSYAIHRGEKDGVENPHCHLMISERKNDGIDRDPGQWFKRFNRKEPESGGAEKSSSLKPKDWLHETRQRWQEHANGALEQHGHKARIDHRSHADRGTLLIPQVHTGHVAAALERQGIATPQGDLNRQIKLANTQMLRAAREIRSIDKEIAQIKKDAEAAKKAPQTTKAPDPAESPSVKRKTAEIEAQKRETAYASDKSNSAAAELATTGLKLRSIGRELKAAQQAHSEAVKATAEARAKLDGISGWFKGKERKAATAGLEQAQQREQQANSGLLDIEAKRSELVQQHVQQQRAAEKAKAQLGRQEQALAKLTQQRTEMVERISKQPAQDAKPKRTWEDIAAEARRDRGLDQSHGNDGPELG